MRSTHPPASRRKLPSSIVGIALCLSWAVNLLLMAALATRMTQQDEKRGFYKLAALVDQAAGERTHIAPAAAGAEAAAGRNPCRSFPSVSAIIPYHRRRPRTLLQAVSSALNQTYDGDVEAVVVDATGAGGDARRDLDELLSSVAGDGGENRPSAAPPGRRRAVEVVRTDPPPGTHAGFVRNVGVGASSGDLLAFLDSDDAWLPTKLERQVEFGLSYDLGPDFFSSTESFLSTTCRWNRSSAAVAPWDVAVLAEAGRALARRGPGVLAETTVAFARDHHPQSFVLYNGGYFRRRMGEIWNGTAVDGTNLPPLWSWRDMRRHDSAVTSTVVMSRRVFDAVGGFNETIRRMEDWELWTRVLRHPRGSPHMGYLSVPLAIYDGCHGKEGEDR